MTEGQEEKQPSASAIEFMTFLYEFRDETDRAAVILGAARLDLLLYQLLIKFLLPNPTATDDLFEYEGPLSSLSAKTNLTLRLGLIDASLAHALHLIRRIRNSFAHETTGCKLDSGAHKDRVKELILPLEEFDRYGELRKGFSDKIPASSADFRTALAVVAVRLDHALKNTNLLAPPESPLSLIPPHWFAKDPYKLPEK